MSSVPAAIGQIIGAPESHFRYVKSRIITLNPNRIVRGITEALDWPPKPFEPDTFYMILGDMQPRAGFGTRYSLGLTTLVQWAWMIPGDDLAQNQVGRNRGNRFRKNQQMMAEIIYGLFPNFCQKQIWSAVENNGQIIYQGVDINPPEQIWWSYPEFKRFQAEDEKSSGIAYRVAQIGLSQFGDAINQ